MNPWPAVPRPTYLTVVGVLGLVLLAALVQPGAGIPPFVARVAQLGLAGGAAYLLDDAAAQLTTVTPPGWWRRRAPGLVVGGTLLVAAWFGLLLVLAWQDSRPPVLTATVELLVLSLAAMAAAAVLVRRGDPEPGVLVAPAIVLIGLTAVIAESVLRTTILLPWDEAGPGRGIATVWAGAGLLATGVLLLASRDPATRFASLWVRSPRRRSTDSGSA